MKAYTDLFGKPFAADDIKVYTMFVVTTRNGKPYNLVRNFKVGIVYANRVIKLLKDAGVVNADGALLLRTVESATNAALRQLKKGMK